MKIPNYVAAEIIEDAVIILNLNSGTYFGLDDLGARIWSLLGRTASIDELCNILLEEYDVAPNQLRADVESLLEELCSKGLLEWEDKDC